LQKTTWNLILGIQVVEDWKIYEKEQPGIDFGEFRWLEIGKYTKKNNLELIFWNSDGWRSGNL